MQWYQGYSFDYENGISNLAFRPQTCKVLVIKHGSSPFHVMFQSLNQASTGFWLVLSPCMAMSFSLDGSVPDMESKQGCFSTTKKEKIHFKQTNSPCITAH